MKRKLFFAATAATLLFTGCANDEYVGEVENPRGELTEITFASKNAGITRAGENLTGQTAATALDKNFVVVGYKNVNSENKIVFDHYNVNYYDGTANSTLSNTAGWEYVGQDMKVRGTNPEKSLATNVTTQTIKYWDYSASSYDFVAFSMGKGYSSGEGQTTTYATPTAVNWTTLANNAYTLTGDFNTLKECYISDKNTVQKPASGSYGPEVKLQFRHLTSKIRMALYETVPGYVVNNVKFYESESASSPINNAVLYGTNAFNQEGKYTISFPNLSSVPHVSFDAATDGGEAATEKANAREDKLTFSTVTYSNDTENAISEGNNYLGQSSSKASYCGGTNNNGKDFTVILPNEGQTSTLTLKIDYTLTSTDGSGETINVKGATAVVPAQYAAWKPGYAYTYLFKISQNTNGSTGEPGSDPTGLTAISFDAVVLADEVTGQETITTVSDPSITTYGYNSTTNTVTTDGDEYASGTDIYATVYDSNATETDKTKAPQYLFTVIIDNDAVQEINESTIKNALYNGTKTYDPTETTKITKIESKADANNKKLTLNRADASTVNNVPAQDGKNLNINALKWTATATTVYVVIYDKDDTLGAGNNEYFKIVRTK